VSVVAGELQGRNLIQYTRGRITLLDLAGLEKLSCECYRVVRDHLRSLADHEETYGRGGLEVGEDIVDL
jgi:hypothetical protein